ncbi:aldehyde dehydrogenase family protein [Streptomyces himalayensis]|uniref:aldehyde dehydrogenase family protein n=1 Tax=Streptomyces himalayensis TaxID=2820085 RepID=UPI0035E457C1
MTRSPPTSTRASPSATLAVDGREHPVTCGYIADGFWLGPTLFDDVKPGMSVHDDEIFGPVLSVVRVASYDEGRDPVRLLTRSAQDPRGPP